MDSAHAQGTEYIEEMTVVESKSLLAYKFEMEMAEDKMYDLYNALNDDDEFDVICEKMRGTYSRIKQRTCRGRFELEPLTEVDRIRIENGMLPRINPPELMRKKSMVLDKMEKLANENPEFREALFELTRVSREFAAEKQARCSGRLACSDGKDSKEENQPDSASATGQ